MLNQELIDLAVQLYDETKSGNAVARRLHISPPTAGKLLKAGGITLPSRFSKEVNERKKSLHGELAQSVAADYGQSLSMKALKKKYKVGTFAILTAVKDHGVKQRPKGGRVRRFSPKEIAEMVRLYGAGLSQVRIGIKFHTHQNSVSRILRNAGIVTRGGQATGAAHGSWKGGRSKHMSGYWSVKVSKDDPYACMRSSTGYVLEQRLVMAKSLGRPLHSYETVHHINGVRTDNRLENLQLRVGNHGFGAAMKCLDCGSQNVSFVPIMSD